MTARVRRTGPGTLSRAGQRHPSLIPASPFPGTAKAAMATLYPSLEDMKGHQLLQVSAGAAALGGVSWMQWVPPLSEGPQGGWAAPQASPISLQAQAAAGVRTPPTTVVPEKPKLSSDTGNAGWDRLSPPGGCLRGGGISAYYGGLS